MTDTDRNDELLLKLGWTYNPEDRAYAWKRPDGTRVFVRDVPRPYDSVMKAIGKENQ